MWPLLIYVQMVLLVYFPDQPLKTSAAYITRKCGSVLSVPYIFPPNEGLISTRGTYLLQLVYKARGVHGPLLLDLMQIACIDLDPSTLLLGFPRLGSSCTHAHTLGHHFPRLSYKMSSWNFLSSTTDSMSLVHAPPWRILSSIHSSPFLRS